MKYSAIVLACVLAVAVADFNNGQYVPEKQNNNYNKYNTYKPARFQYQNQPFVSSTPSPLFVSSTPFPSRFVSSTPVPVTIAPARSSVSFIAPTNLQATPSVATPTLSLTPSFVPARSVFNAPSVVTVRPVSAAPFRSWSSPKAALPTPSAVPARSVFSTVPAASVQAELPAQSAAPTQAAKLEYSAVPARSALPTPSASSAQWVAPAAPAVPETPVISIAPVAEVAPVAPVARVAQVVSVAPVAPVYQAAKIALPVARYVSDAGAAETVRYSNQINADGAFEYSYETNNGIVAQEQGSPRSFYSGEEAVAPVVAQGSFGWTSPEGQQMAMTYVADEYGYHPEGAAIPPQLARALAYLTSRQI